MKSVNIEDIFWDCSCHIDDFILDEIPSIIFDDYCEDIGGTVIVEDIRISVSSFVPLNDYY